MLIRELRLYAAKESRSLRVLSHQALLMDIASRRWKEAEMEGFTRKRRPLSVSRKRPVIPTQSLKCGVGATREDATNTKTKQRAAKRASGDGRMAIVGWISSSVATGIRVKLEIGEMGGESGRDGALVARDFAALPR